MIGGGFGSKPGYFAKSAEFANEVHQVFAVMLSNFYHVLQGSYDDTIPCFIPL